MSLYSDKLQSFIFAARISVAQLSRTSGVERSYIQKMLSSERIPGDVTVLERLSDALMLTPAEKKQLRETYYISKMGEEVYYRRIQVKRIIEDADSYFQEPDFFATPQTSLSHMESHSNLPVQIIQGKASVIDWLHFFLSREASGPESQLMAVLQPDCEAGNVFRSYCRLNRQLQVEHIVAFQTETRYQTENRYNLSCMRELLPILLSCCRYAGWFYYISSPSCQSSVLPFFIVGKRWVMTFSHDNEKAILFRENDAVLLYQRIFREMQEDCFPLFETENLYPVQFWDHQRWRPMQQDMCYSLQFEPCFGFFYSMDMVEKLLRQGLPNRQQILSFFKGRREQITLMAGTKRSTSFFTEEGLDRILQTGRIQELPSELYSPLPKAYRVELLRRMIFCIHKGWYFPHLIKPQKFRCPHNLMFFVSDNQHLSCGCLHPVYGSISVTLHEKSIVYSICDFLEFLQETALIDSVEETEAILTQKLKELTES